MAITAFTNPVNGLWPIGQFTIVAVGTPVNLNLYIGPQTEAIATPVSPSQFVRGLLLFAGVNNTGPVFLMRKVKGQTVTAAGTPNFVVGIVYPGASLDLSGFATAAINPDDYCLDTTTAGNTVTVTAKVSG